MNMKLKTIRLFFFLFVFFFWLISPVAFNFIFKTKLTLDYEKLCR